MQKLFGTDGIRNESSHQFFSSKSLCTFAKALAHFIQLRNPNRKSTVLIGLDGRFSGPNIQDHLVHWLVLNNIQIAFCEYENTKQESSPLAEKMRRLSPETIISTPFLSHMVKKYFDFGIMITASHNPFLHNGLKLFNADGEKLSLEEETEIESLFFNPSQIQPQKNLNLSTNILHRDYVIINDDQLSIYKNKFNLEGIKLLIDCANGGTSFIAPKIFNGKEHIIINNSPNGKNINLNCGSEFSKNISNLILKNNADIGIAFDGDGDRVVFIDEKGKKLSGDQILAICANFFKNQKLLKNNTVVITSMSNYALISFLKKINVNVIITDVGDRNVLYKMKDSNSILGGENSGHFIFKNYCSCGDGILSALIIIDIIKQTKKKLSELASILNLYPQKITNVKVRKKPPLKELHSLQNIIKNGEKQLNKEGRILVRYSGTESICRVLIEGLNVDIIEKYSKLISDEISLLIGE